MKTILAPLSFLIFFTQLYAQKIEGIITYEQVITIKTDRLPPQVRDIIPPERKSTMQLLFNKEEALYKRVKKPS